MIVHTHQSSRGDDQVVMAVSLEGDGDVALFFEGIVHTTCHEHGKVLEHRLSFEVGCTSKMNKVDMDEVELALRGDEQASFNLCWRTIDQVIAKVVTKEDRCPGS